MTTIQITQENLQNLTEERLKKCRFDFDIPAFNKLNEDLKDKRGVDKDRTWWAISVNFGREHCRKLGLSAFERSVYRDLIESRAISNGPVLGSSLAHERGVQGYGTLKMWCRALAKLLKLQVLVLYIHTDIQTDLQRNQIFDETGFSDPKPRLLQNAASIRANLLQAINSDSLETEDPVDKEKGGSPAVLHDAVKNDPDMFGVCSRVWPKINSMSPEAREIRRIEEKKKLEEIRKRELQEITSLKPETNMRLVSEYGF